MMQCYSYCVFAALRLLALVALGFPCGCFFSQSATTLGALCSSSPRPIQYEYLYQEFKISLRCMVARGGRRSLRAPIPALIEARPWRLDALSFTVLRPAVYIHSVRLWPALCPARVQV